MQPRTTKILIAVTLIASAGVGLHLIGGLPSFNSKQITGNSLDKFSNDPSASGSPSVKLSSKPVAISSAAILSPGLAEQKNTVIYFQHGTGQLITADIFSRSEQNSLVQFPDLTRMIWSPRKFEGIALFSGKKVSGFQLYNVSTKVLTPLDKSIRDVAFSPDGIQIAYFQYQKDEGTISVASPDGSVSKKLLTTRLSSVRIFWPSADHIYFIATQDGWDSLFSLTLDGQLNKIIDSQKNLDVIFDRSGQQALVSFADDSGSLVNWIKNLQNDTDAKLDIKTPASTCVFSLDGQSVYCGLPRTVVLDPQLSRAVPQDLAEIDIKSGQRTALVTSGSQNVNVQNIFLDDLEQYLIFTNGFDGRLYELEI